MTEIRTDEERACEGEIREMVGAMLELGGLEFGRAAAGSSLVADWVMQILRNRGWVSPA